MTTTDECQADADTGADTSSAAPLQAGAAVATLNKIRDDVFHGEQLEVWSNELISDLFPYIGCDTYDDNVDMHERVKDFLVSTVFERISGVLLASTSQLEEARSADDALQQLRSQPDTRECTCHPDDAPVPCQKQYALTHCQLEAARSQLNEAVGEAVGIEIHGATEYGGTPSDRQLGNAALAAIEASDHMIIPKKHWDSVIYALRSYSYGNASHELAEGVLQCVAASSLSPGGEK